jgi:predicted nucleic acid-binding protein
MMIGTMLMSDGVSHLFWDSCVFYAFLRDERTIYDVDSIEQYLQEAKAGKNRIYTSSIALAEVVPSAITKPGIGSFLDFIDDFQGAIIIVDTTPNVMALAAQLKDLPYKKGNSPGRRLGTPDAIMLAGCLATQDVLGVKIDFFHTFDDGKKRGPEGKMVPLISYEDWCEGFNSAQMNVVDRVIKLNRRKPIHPHPDMFRGAK